METGQRDFSINLKLNKMNVEIKVKRNDLNVYYQGKKVLKYAVLNDFVKLVWSKKAFVNYCVCEVWQIEDEITEKYDKPIQRTR